MSIDTNSSCCESLIDNTVVTASGNAAPSVDLYATDDLLVGNTYNVSSAVSNVNGGRLAEINDTVNTGLTVPTSVALPPVPPNNSRTIYDVALNTGNDARPCRARSTARWPPAITRWCISPARCCKSARRITVPGNARIQIIGDGAGPYPTGTLFELGWQRQRPHPAVECAQRGAIARFFLERRQSAGHL